MFENGFESITRDVGQELKETARRIYSRGLWCCLGLLIIELIAALIAAAEMEIVSIMLALPFVAVIEYWLIMGRIHIVTIKLYAEGEIVHLLKQGNEQVQVMLDPQMRTEQIRSMVKQAPAIELDSFWECSNCKTKNKQKYSQCKMCGAFRNGTIPVQQSKQERMVAEETIVAEIDNIWICKRCGSQNKQQYGQCKKCGTFRG